MKRAFPLLLLIAALAGCGGSDSTGPGGNNGGTYYYRFDANGTRVNFTQQQSVMATFSQSGNQRLALITGFDATRNSAVQIYSGSTIATGTYTGYTLDAGNAALRGVLVHYQDASGTLYQPDAGAPITDVVTITELTATTVRGTFNARLKAAGRPDMVITNGEFFVQRTN